MSHAWAKFPCFCALAGLSIAASLVHAQDSPMATQLACWPTAASDHRLDDTRGGFDLGNGLLASFGIDRVVYINGSLVSSTSVYVPDVGRMTLGQASALAAAARTVNLVQNGTGNSIAPTTFDHATAATVIQNSLDNQDIRSLTTINAAVNSQAAFRNLGLQEALQAGLVGSLGH
ncbi:hypothetical protein EAH75_05275 [Rhodanobacter glycinis]|uniref:Uncharacterized protein n=1 Tax=Rhodanobacter glycinis TaxID=582702 RepID=A0A502FMS3_9GAMM|nr:hypothetical protein [Rhodanobacter glycinis]TPG10261.1 hypothetical protein EAH88_07875 [Rhodanobacter glycinis]TPG50828.1 hypothetical protein EAH75_05275 [Rhodanobacter glycinis]